MRPARALVLAVVVGCGGGGADEPLDGATPVDSAEVDADAAPIDPCPVAPACPSLPAGYGVGDGLRAIDRCGFPLTDLDTWAAADALLDALPASVPQRTLADVVTELNRVATPVTAAAVPGDPPGVRVAFTWQAGDRSVAYWIPQGLTGSFDATLDGRVAGRKLVLVSWYHERAEEPGATVDKGVRLAIVDVTDPAAIRYRLVLLVEPIARGGRTDFAPVAVHAGGLAWHGDHLWVPDTGTGFRVFDLGRLFEVDASVDALGYDATTGAYHAHGYRYVVPQIGRYRDDDACAPRFSFVALDRSTTPPSLVSGEYDATSIGGRLYRWPLDADTGHLAASSRGRVVPDGAWFAGQTHLQGAAARGDTFWLSSSAPAGGAGALYRAGIDRPSVALPWIDSPEDLAVDEGDGLVWSLSEAIDARYVIGVARTAID